MGPPPERVSGPGAAAVDGAVRRADGPVVARHHPRAPHRFRGHGPVREVVVTRPDDHWHLVTLGLSELDAKESDDPAVSGWGFELTFRLRAAEEPLWAVELLANLAGYVWTTRHGFGPGHHLDLGGPIQLGTTSAVTAGVIVRDPGLPALAGPFGEVEFLQLLGLTADELEACRANGTEAVVEVIARGNPLLVTDVGRGSKVAGLAAPRIRTPAAELRVRTLRWQVRMGRLSVELGAGAATALGPALRRALAEPGGRLGVRGDAGELAFVAADAPGWELNGDGLVVQVPAAELPGLVAL
ncbi:MAG: suppressor of fused domain protein, partial [Acidimicrobiales bacterium]